MERSWCESASGVGVGQEEDRVQARRQRKERKKNREKRSGWTVKEDQGRETTYRDKRNMEDKTGTGKIEKRSKR
jgi:hypothetical protein